MSLIERVGLAIWGERWQSEMARAIGVHRDTVQDWRQQRSEPKPGVYRDLMMVARERRAGMDAIVAELEQQVSRLG